MCGESWLAIKDLQPTAPVLKAGIQVSWAQCVCRYGFGIYIYIWASPFFCLSLAGVLYTCGSCTQGLRANASLQECEMSD